MKNKRITKLALADEKTLLGEKAITEVPFKIEISSGDLKYKMAFSKYMRKLKTEKKKIMKEQAKEFEAQALLDSYLLQNNVNDQEDELYTNFVKNAFEDHFEDFDNDEVRHEL